MKVSEDQVKDAIKTAQYHRFPGTTTIVCCLTLYNDFNAVGSSACVDPSEFNEQMGKDIAFKKAFGEAWAYLGFRLAERMHAQKEG